MSMSRHNNSQSNASSQFHHNRSDVSVAVQSSSRDYHLGIVFTILKEAYEKLKISLIFPQIFENPQTLSKYLQDTQFEKVAQLVMEYRHQRKNQSFEPPAKPNYQLVNIIDYIHENYKLLDLLPHWLDDINNDEKSILETFSQLLEIAQDHFRQTALSELAKEKHLHEVYTANERVTKEIGAILTKIEQRKMNKKWKAAAKSGAIKDMEDELFERQRDNQIQVSAEIVKSNREMHKLSNAASAQQKELNEEYEKARYNYESKLKIDLKQEKIIRDEKNKYQSQLELLIKKYDQVMRDKNTEELYVIEQYDQLKLEYDEFLIEYNGEYSNYDEIVRQRERECEAKIRRFFDNLAARRLQRWWRRLLRQKRKRDQTLAKASKKKGKGGAKEKPVKAIKAKEVKKTMKKK